MTINFKNLKIAVIGDAMIDKYIFGQSERISPENPIPVVKYNHEEYKAGGAANVAVNLSNLGVKTTLFSLISIDKDSKRLLSILKKNKINNLSIISKNIMSTVKERIYSNDYQIARLDKEEKYEGNLSRKLVDKIIKNIKKFDAIIVSDYGKGVIDKSLTKLIRHANKNRLLIAIDPHVKSKNFYKKSGLITPNLKEFETLVEKRASLKNIKSLSLKLKKELQLKYLIITLGSAGIVFLDQDNQYKHMHTTPKSVYDVVGAGDTVIAVLTASLANKIDIKKSIIYSLRAGSLVVQKKGTSFVTVEELITPENINENKVITLNNFIKKRKNLNEKKIIFTNGCFDIFHAGHLDYLKKASKLGDMLVVGLNDDKSVKSLKGKYRPVNNFNSRAAILSNLDFVDFIIPFSDFTPIKLIKSIKPKIIAKGGDYSDKKSIVGYQFLKKYGGEIVIIRKKYNTSSTKILKKFQN